MNRSAVIPSGVLFSFLAVANFAAAAVEETVIAPYSTEGKYVISERGVHAAGVVRKGSRLSVYIDGVAGPKIDDIITPSARYVDPRSALEDQRRAMFGEPVDQITAQPVTFSKDGKRSAYIARIGQEWVLFVDGKELLRLPMAGAVGATSGMAGMAGNTDVRLQFSGMDGQHLLFAKSGYQGYELWVDGQKWPGFYKSAGSGGDGTLDPIISPDGEHIAYMAQIDREKRSIILDGKDVGYYAADLRFTPDSKHLISRADTPKGTAVLVDGKPMFTAKQILALYVAQSGHHIGAVLAHAFPDNSRGQFLLLDGKPVEATLCKNEVKSVVFSADGKHWAAICSNAPNIWYAVVDGKKGQEYTNIVVGFGTAPTFSPDSTKFVYLATAAGGKYFLVTNDDESDAFDGPVKVLFSADGKHMISNGLRNGVQPVFYDGQPVASSRDTSLQTAGTFTICADGTHYAYRGSGQYGGEVYYDGKSTGFAGTTFALSADGKHLAISGTKIGGQAQGIIIDGQLLKTGERSPTYETFTPDAQHVFYVCREPAQGPNAAPGQWDFVTYLDGKSVAHCDSAHDFFLPLGQSRHDPSRVAAAARWESRAHRNRRRLAEKIRRDTRPRNERHHDDRRRARDRRSRESAEEAQISRRETKSSSDRNVQFCRKEAQKRLKKRQESRIPIRLSRSSSR